MNRDHVFHWEWVGPPRFRRDGLAYYSGCRQVFEPSSPPSPGSASSSSSSASAPQEPISYGLGATIFCHVDKDERPWVAQCIEFCDDPNVVKEMRRQAAKEAGSENSDDERAIPSWMRMRVSLRWLYRLGDVEEDKQEDVEGHPCEVFWSDHVTGPDVNSVNIINGTARLTMDIDAVPKSPPVSPHLRERVYLCRRFYRHSMAAPPAKRLRKSRYFPAAQGTWRWLADGELEAIRSKPSSSPELFFSDATGGGMNEREPLFPRRVKSEEKSDVNDEEEENGSGEGGKGGSSVDLESSVDSEVDFRTRKSRSKRSTKRRRSSRRVRADEVSDDGEVEEVPVEGGKNVNGSKGGKNQVGIGIAGQGYAKKLRSSASPGVSIPKTPSGGVVPPQLLMEVRATRSNSLAVPGADASLGNVLSESPPLNAVVGSSAVEPSRQRRSLPNRDSPSMAGIALSAPSSAAKPLRKNRNGVPPPRLATAAPSAPAAVPAPRAGAPPPPRRQSYRRSAQPEPGALKDGANEVKVDTYGRGLKRAPADLPPETAPVGGEQNAAAPAQGSGRKARMVKPAVAGKTSAGMFAKSPSAVSVGRAFDSLSSQQRSAMGRHLPWILDSIQARLAVISAKAVENTEDKSGVGAVTEEALAGVVREVVEKFSSLNAGNLMKAEPRERGQDGLL